MSFPPHLGIPDSKQGSEVAPFPWCRWFCCPSCAPATCSQLQGGWQALEIKSLLYAGNPAFEGVHSGLRVANVRGGVSVVSRLENIVDPCVILCLYLERGILQRACISACSPGLTPGPEGLGKAGQLVGELCGRTP